jgi:alanyl-tRNA synthetase
MVDLYSWLKRADSTELLYLNNPYLKTVSVSLLDYACDKPGKCYLVFDKTIFHPKTGGRGAILAGSEARASSSGLRRHLWLEML